jgi:hypothetical protein
MDELLSALAEVVAQVHLLHSSEALESTFGHGCIEEKEKISTTALVIKESRLAERKEKNVNENCETEEKMFEDKDSRELEGGMTKTLIDAVDIKVNEQFEITEPQAIQCAGICKNDCPLPEEATISGRKMEKKKSR